MKKHMLIITILLVLITFSTGMLVSAEENIFSTVDSNNNLRLGNDYIVIVENQDNNAEGRFAIETTGGAPLRDNDNNKPLVYGRPKPWTSYTTIRIDGENFVFGGKTGRRAGGSANYGEVITSPEIRDDAIYTATRFGDIVVEQILGFTKSSTTGLFDSVEIKYRIKNNSTELKNIGLRIMLDTMLGENDGAPFRAGENAITTDRMYTRGKLPNFWQAFDSISSPHVTSQGTLKGPGVTAPDEVYFSDWGSLADGAWNFDFNEGEEFIRKGEYEIDSAIALMWEPVAISPGKEETFVTTYGLGGITIVPGLISLGVTSPAEVMMDKTNWSFPVIAYIENTSEITARDVQIRLNLPESFATDEPAKKLGDFAAGDISQVVWTVKPATEQVPEKIEYEVIVGAQNTDSNRVTRVVDFVGPPRIEAGIELKDKLTVEVGKLTPNPFTVQAQIKNSGGSVLYDAVTELILPPGLVLAPKEKSIKYLGYLKKDEVVNVNWQVKALNVTGELPFAVDAWGLNNYSTTAVNKLDLPDLKTIIYLDKEGEGSYFTVNVKGVNISKIDKFEVVLNYNPEQIKPVYISRGNIFVKDGRLIPWQTPEINENEIKINQDLPSDITDGTIASIHFKRLKEGDITIDFGESTFLNKDGNEINVKQEKLY